MMKTAASLAFMALLGFSNSAIAQYTGPTAGKDTSADPIKTATQTGVSTTVRDLTASGKDDSQVILQGRIVRQLSRDKYRFADNTGEIDLEIETEHWPVNTPIDEKAEVRIMGEYDKKLIGAPEVEVERIEKAK